jgi:hypothetical protein
MLGIKYTQNGFILEVIRETILQEEPYAFGLGHSCGDKAATMKQLRKDENIIWR